MKRAFIEKNTAGVTGLMKVNRYEHYQAGVQLKGFSLNSGTIAKNRNHIKLAFISIAVLLVFALGMVSCGPNQAGMSNMPAVSGSAGELLVVIDKAKWNDALGDSLQNIFAAPIPMLPTAEPYFDITHIQDNNFNGVFKKHRNILIVNVKPGNKVSAVSRNDVWASPQIVIEISAPSEDSAISLLGRDGLIIRDKFVAKERDRWSDIFKHSYNDKILKTLKEKYHISMYVPQAYSLDVQKKNFFWISSGTGEGTIGIIGWTYPYESKDQLLVDRLIAKRNEVVRQNVPGPVDGSYMTTEDLIKPTTREFIYNGQFFVRMDGLWKLKGAFMGGPFTSLTTIDNKTRQIITVEAFFHDPRESKRNWMRQLEGIIYTLQVTDNE